MTESLSLTFAYCASSRLIKDIIIDRKGDWAGSVKPTLVAFSGLIRACPVQGLEGAQTQGSSA